MRTNWLGSGKFLIGIFGANCSSGLAVTRAGADVVAELIRYANNGSAGITTAFADYSCDLPYFAQEVLPRVQKKGVR
jgi:nucleoside permease NupC